MDKEQAIGEVDGIAAEVIWSAMTCSYANALDHPGKGLRNFYKPESFAAELTNKLYQAGYRKVDIPKDKMEAVKIELKVFGCQWDLIGDTDPEEIANESAGVILSLISPIDIVINLDDVEGTYHYHAIRNWVIKLKNGNKIELSADVVKEIVKHENSEVPPIDTEWEKKLEPDGVRTPMGDLFRELADPEFRYHFVKADKEAQEEIDAVSPIDTEKLTVLSDEEASEWLKNYLQEGHLRGYLDYGELQRKAQLAHTIKEIKGE